MRHIEKLNPWALDDVLREKYAFSHTDAAAMADFLLPMLHVDPVCHASTKKALFLIVPNPCFVSKCLLQAQRATAARQLTHGWVQKTAAELAAEEYLAKHNVA